MNEYLLDTNIVIGLWKCYPSVINKLIKDKRIRILKEVSEELAVKEKKNYKGQQVLSERFCNLIPFIINSDKKEIEEFYSMLNLKYSKSGNAYFDNTEKLSQNDLALLYTCFLDNDLILVTEDKYLFKAASHVLGINKVISLKILIEEIIQINNF